MKKRHLKGLLAAACAAMIISQPVYAFGGGNGNGIETRIMETASVSTVSGADKDIAAAGGQDDDGGIEAVETPSYLDENGNVVVNVYTSEDTVLPVTMLMKNGSDTFSMTITRSGQQIKVKPGKYSVTEYTDGNGKRKKIRAILRISDQGGDVQLDFHNPDDTSASTFKGLLSANILFIPIAAIMFFAFKWYRKNYSA